MAKIYCKSSYILRKDTSENWKNKNPILRKGEQGLETDTGIIKIGDGVTAFNSLSDDNIYLPKSRINKSVDDVKSYANSTFANALKGNKSDTAMLLDDVSPVTHEMGVKVKSKNLIPYPYINTTKEENGITFTDNGDGSITISGKAERDAYFYLCTVDFGSNNMWNESANSNGYYVSGCKHFFYNKSNKVSVIVVPSGTDYSTNPITVKPQIELGTTATDYTPYVSDLTAVKVSRCGKNLFDNNKLSEWGLTLSDGKYTGNVSKLNSKTLFSSFKSNTRYTISVKASNLSKSSATLLIIINYTDGTTQTVIRVNSTTEKVYSFTSTANKSISNITSIYYDVDTINIAYIQIEEGTIATEYEPYKGADYTPTADGTVEGVTSLYPNTTLTTDTNGVLIDCEYNMDINKAFAELQQAIISLGGNV